MDLLPLMIKQIAIYSERKGYLLEEEEVSDGCYKAVEAGSVLVETLFRLVNLTQMVL